MAIGFKPWGGLNERLRVPGLVAAREDLEEWLDTPTGRDIIDQQRAFCREQLTGLGGYRLLQLGISPAHNLLDSFDQLHKFDLYPIKVSGVSAVCEYEALPLPAESIDIVLLHHVLEFSPSPHRVLKEVARVVAPGGHVVLLGFNPLSWFGIEKWPAMFFSNNRIWRRHSLRAARVTDWLQLLSFQLVPPCRERRDLMYYGELERDWSFRALPSWAAPVHGRFYLLVARKQVVRLTASKLKTWSPMPVPAFRANCRQQRAHIEIGESKYDPESR